MESSNNNDNYYILLVDDEKDILELFTEYLSSNGFNIVSFQNPLDALEYFYQNQRRIKMEVSAMEKTLEQLKKLYHDIYNLEAYQKLEETLIDNIESVSLEEYQFIP